MSMQSYPMVEDAAFLLDSEVAAYIALASDQANNSVPNSIAVLSPSEFAAAAWGESLPKEYYNMGWLETTEDYKFVPSFDGFAETLFPEKTCIVLDASFSSSPICYIPAAQTVYTSPEELLNEFKKNPILSQLNYLEGFNWWRNIVKIKGTALAEEDV